LLIFQEVVGTCMNILSLRPTISAVAAKFTATTAKLHV